MRKAADRHDAGDNGNVDACRFTFVDEAIVRIGIVEILRDRRIRTCVNLALECREIFLRTFRLRMDFRIGGNLNYEVPAEFLANEVDKLIRKAKFARRSKPGREVTAQGNEMTYAVVFITLQPLPDVFARRCHARNMRRGRMTHGANVEHRAERALTR